MHENSSDRHAYLNSEWFHFLPLWIFIAFAVLTIIAMAFGGAAPSAFLIYIVTAALLGLLIWWLCDINQVGWAWFVLLLPLILAMATSVVTAGVAAGNLSSAAAVKYLEKRTLV